MAVINYYLILGLIFFSFLCDVLGKQTDSFIGVPVESSYVQGNKTVNETVQGKNKTVVEELLEDLVSINGVKHYKNTSYEKGVIKHIKKHSMALLKRGTTGYKLPQNWSNFCKVLEDEFYVSEFTQRTKLTSIKCVIDSAYPGIMTISDLRKNFDYYKDLNLRFSLYIECRSMANISFPLSFKVRQLFVLKIKGCVILAEFNKNVIETTPDSLRIIYIWNSKLIVPLSIFNRNIIWKRPFYCCQEKTLEESSTRNISFKLMEDSNILKVLTPKIVPPKNLPVCNFSHLLKLDTSNGKFINNKREDVYENLRIYNASNKNMTVITKNFMHWSRKFPKLEIMDLSHNNISNLYRFNFPLNTNLGLVTKIDLQYNRITSITVNDLEKFKQMTTVLFDLRHNPIDCSCSGALEELIKYIKKGKHLQKLKSKSDYSYIENMTCKTPDDLQDMTLKSLTSEIICGSKLKTEYFIVPIICLSVSIVVFAILLFTVLRFRQEIAILLFIRFNIIVPCQTRDNYYSEKKYDAFVSYSSKEEEYVEKLFEDLEKQPDDKSRSSFKFCMHHRDFVPGKTIFDNVTVSIESSRHTIILLSNHFIKSEYCLYEFQEAFRQSIMEKRRHLVLVMLEDIPTEDLPRDLRRCVNTFTYIRKDDSLFVERLVYALTIKHKGKTARKKERTHCNDSIDYQN